MGKGKEDEKKKATKQKPPGSRVKQECAALIKSGPGRYNRWSNACQEMNEKNKEAFANIQRHISEGKDSKEKRVYCK